MSNFVGRPGSLRFCKSAQSVGSGRATSGYSNRYEEKTALCSCSTLAGLGRVSVCNENISRQNTTAVPTRSHRTWLRIVFPRLLFSIIPQLFFPAAILADCWSSALRRESAAVNQRLIGGLA